uniref:Cytochrome c oxidase assembly protein COX16 homolog, mitochondrial n=1 Tax=Ditylenchus dipsaci TaxID=166011 RepID=A0A915D6C6_9BILA
MNRLSDQRVKRIAALVLGTFAGAFMIDCQYRPLESLENKLEMGKIELSQKYQRIREERRIRQMEWQEGIFEPQSKKEPHIT